jgi:muconolactone D-isomerase
MLFAVRMDVDIPASLDPATREDLVAREKSYCRELQESGTWLHIWRVVGRYANISVFDAESNQELHDLLWRLPLFPYMTVSVTPLAQHPSDLAAET